MLLVGYFDNEIKALLRLSSFQLAAVIVSI